MSDDGWSGKDHPTIQADLLKLVPDDASRAGQSWQSVSTLATEANQLLANARNKLEDGNDFWTGEGPGAAYDTLDSVYKKTVEPPKIAKEISDDLYADAGILASAKHVATNNPTYDVGAAASSASPETVQAEQQRRLEKIRREAQSYYTDALSGRRASMLDQLNGEEPKYPGGNDTGTGTGTGGGGGNNGGSGNGTTDKNTQADGLADKSTKPAYSEGSGNGQGQGQGSGSGSGGGSPQSGSGSGTGSGLGNALSGLGTGTDKTGGLAPGTTTAAGLGGSHGSGSGTGTLGSGPGALRAGGLPPGAGAGNGTNPAGIGGAGVRGGMGGMGMGMAPMAGAHGARGKGEDDDEHTTPDYMINLDNGNELFGNLPKASPGVLGDWTEHEDAERRRREAEIKRYKSMGWDVKFD